MATTIRAAISLSLLLAVPTNSEQASGFLASRRGETSTTRQRAMKERLRKSMSNVASVLRTHRQETFPADFFELPLFASDARDLLMRESHQPYLSDNAELLRDYARRAPDYVLVMPFEDMFQAESPLSSFDSSYSRPVGHAVSEETVVQTNKDGKSVSQTTRCLDGHCKTAKTSGGKADKSDALVSDVSVHDTALQQSVEQMTKAMADMERSFGRGSLDDALGSIFHEARHQSTKSASSTAAHDDKKKESRSTSALAKALKSSKSMQQQTMSSETRIENGKVVTRTKSCKNGHCKTQITTEDVVPMSDSEDDGERASSSASSSDSLDLASDDLVW